MIRNKKEMDGMIKIDLTGPQGNVFFLIGAAQKLSKSLGLDPEKVSEEMMAGNYNNAVDVFDKYFGEYVILYR